jgi:D-alanyl-D-alanine dipeptidase
LKVFSYIMVPLTAALALYMFTASYLWLEYEASPAEYTDLGNIPADADQFHFRYSTLERHILELGFVDAGQVVPGIQVSLSYGSPDNFTGKALYTGIHRAFLYPPVADKLAVAQSNLQAIDSTLSLVILDALRPQHIQQELWDWAVTKGMERYVAQPQAGSTHNYGAALDVTIMTADSLLDMGSAHDAFGPVAEPRYHAQMLAEGKLTPQQVENRLLLKKVMKEAGFIPIQTEWWHYNGVSKETARLYYPLLE